jgi:hypothetical protein
LQKAGASSEYNALPPRDVTAEVIVARKALAQLLAEKAGQAGSSSPHPIQDPHLAVVLDFTASLVADITYSKRFADKSVWHRCVGVYIAPWLPNQKDDSAAFAESICKHFYAIEKVFFFVFSSHCLTAHHCSYRPSTLPFTTVSRKRASSSEILSSPSHMVPFSSYRTQP